MPTRKIPPIHPGEILLEEYLKPLGLSQYRLAKDITVPARRVNEIVHGKRAITADTALRLARFFGTSDRFWLNLQTRYDLEIEKERLKGRLEREVSRYRVAIGQDPYARNVKAHRLSSRIVQHWRLHEKHPRPGRPRVEMAAAARAQNGI
jgi:addiction module HigA family antidote